MNGAENDQEDSFVNKKQQRGIRITCISITFLIIALFIYGIFNHQGKHDISGMLLTLTDKSWMAAAVLLGLFTIKSVSVVIPLSALFIASGILFPTIIGVLISYAGLSIALLLPYFIGKHRGHAGINKLESHYPGIRSIKKYLKEQPFYTVFISRMIGILPGDLLSLYYGSIGIKLPIYMISSLTGESFNLLTATILGESIRKPTSKCFIILLCIRLGIISITTAITIGMNRKMKK